MDLKKFHWILILLLIVFISIFLGRRSIYEGKTTITDNATTATGNTMTNGNTTTTSFSIQDTSANVPDVDAANKKLQNAQTIYNTAYSLYTTDFTKLNNDKINLSNQKNMQKKLIKDITDMENTITSKNQELINVLGIKPEWPKDGSGIQTDQLNFYYPLQTDLVNYAIGVQDITQFDDAAVKDGSLALDERAMQSIILPPITPSAKFAVACWVNTNSGNKWARIFDLGNGPGNNLVAYIGNNGNIGFGTGGLLGDIQPIANQGWNHIAWTFDIDTSGKRQGYIYINGKLVKQFDGSSSPVDVEFKTNFIGQSNWINDPFLAGNISDFRIYNRALSVAEVKQLANYNKPTTTAPSYQPIDSNVLSNEVGVAKQLTPICKLLLDTDAKNTGSNTNIPVKNIGNVLFGKYYNRPCAIFNNNIQNYLTFPFSNQNKPNFSFCYWMYVPVSDNTEYTLISYTNSSWLPSIQADIMLGNNIKMVFALPKHWNDYYHKDLDYRDRWTHVTYTIDQNDFTAQLFVNGKPVAKVKGTGPLGYTPDRFIIGRSGDHGRAFRGGISDFRIYDKVLKPEEVSKIYTEGGGDTGSKQNVNTKMSDIKCSKDRICLSNETDANGVQNYYCYGDTQRCLWERTDCDSDEKCKQKYVNPDGSYSSNRYTDIQNNTPVTCNWINDHYRDTPADNAWPKKACSHPFDNPKIILNKTFLTQRFVAGMPALSLWLDAAKDSSFEFSSSNKIKTWKDSSPNTNNVAQNNINLQPTYTTNVLNGLPSVSFSSGNYLSIPTNTYTSLTNLNLFMVLNVSSKSPNNPSPFSLYSKLTFYLSSSGIPYVTNESAWTYNGSADFVGNSVKTPKDQFILVNLIIRGNSQTISINGVSGNSKNCKFSGDRNLNLHIGYSGYNSNDNYVGFISEVLVCNTELSSQQIQLAEGYLAWKWGLERKLPSKHSYYNVSP